MRTLSQKQCKSVGGGELTNDQATYAITLSAQAAANLALQLGLKFLGTTPTGMVITYVLVPAVNIGTFTAVTDVCNRYFRASQTPTTA